MAFCRSTCLLAAIIATATACDRPKTPPPGESGAGPTATTPAESVGVRRAQLWDPSAGPVLLVEGDASASAVVVPPDSATGATTLATVPQPASVTLFGRGGTVQVAEITAPRDSVVCRPWAVTAAPPPKSWSFGFVGGVVAPQPLDSIESLDRADSTTLATIVTRLASTLPNDSAGRFAALPFSTRALWRFTLTTGQDIVIGTLVRQINQEATPLQERTLIIAERDHSSADSTFALAYSERSYGNEETVETTEVLGAALIGDARRPTVVVSRDFGDAISYGFVDRQGGKWRARWRSGQRACSGSKT
jgi:hypothetical protein